MTDRYLYLDTGSRIGIADAASTYAAVPLVGPFTWATWVRGMEHVASAHQAWDIITGMEVRCPAPLVFDGNPGDVLSRQEVEALEEDGLVISAVEPLIRLSLPLRWHTLYASPDAVNFVFVLQEDRLGVEECTRDITAAWILATLSRLLGP